MLDAETQSASSAQADLEFKSTIALNKHCLVRPPHSDANHQAKIRLGEWVPSRLMGEFFHGRNNPLGSNDSDSATHPSPELYSARIELSDLS
jgi:hypothetical protein